MFPILLFAGIGVVLAYVAKKTKTPDAPVKLLGKIGSDLGSDDDDVGDSHHRRVERQKMRYTTIKGGVLAMPKLKPEAERLLALLVLFARDKENPAGGKRYLSPNTAAEAIDLSRYLGLHKTARAIITDAPIPDDEHLPGRVESVRQSVYSYGTTGKA